MLTTRIHCAEGLHFSTVITSYLTPFFREREKQDKLYCIEVHGGYGSDDYE